MESMFEKPDAREERQATHLANDCLGLPMLTNTIENRTIPERSSTDLS